MITDKLFYIFHSFSSDDWDRFGKFVISPYFVRGNFSKRILDPVKKLYSKSADKEKITLGVFKKKLERIRIKEKYAVNSFSTKLSIFCNNVEQYLILNNFKTDIYQNQKYLLFELIKRNLEFNIGGEIQHINRLTKKSVYGTYDLITLQQIFFMEAVFFLSHNKNKKAFEMFYKQSELFTAYFLEGLMYHLLEFRNISKHKLNIGETLLQVFNNHIDLDSLMEKIESLNSDIFSFSLITFYLLRISEQKNVEDNIEKVKNVFFKYEKKFDMIYRTFIYIELGSAYQKLIDKGETIYYKDNFELLKMQDEKGLIIHIQKGIFALNFFFSCINIGLKMNETKWVEDFIKKYHKQLPDDIKQNEYNVGIALVFFHKKEYEEALISLNKCRNILYSRVDFRYSILKLKVLYETSRIEEAYLEMDRFAHRIKNSNDISPDIKKQGRFFAKLYFKLLKTILDPEKTDLEELLYLVTKTEGPLLEKEWLIAKIDEIKRSNKSI